MKKIDTVFQFIEREGLTNVEFERNSGVSNGYLRNISKTGSEISGKMMRKMYTAYPELEKFIDELEKSKNILSTGEQIRMNKAIGEDEELGLIYVPIAAQAGYSRNFEDPIYINQLERLNIPGLPFKGDNFRYFDVEGDSMYPTLEEGMQVVAQKIEQEDWQHISDYYIHVLVTANRVLIKRLFRKDKEALVLISDNEELYPQEIQRIEDIKELWVVKRRLDWRMTPPKRFEIKL